MISTNNPLSPTYAIASTGRRPSSVKGERIVGETLRLPLETVPQCPLTIIPAKAGVQNRLKALVSGFRWKDKKVDCCLNNELRHPLLAKRGWVGFLDKNDERGFTLLEIVITLILAVFVGSMLIEYMGTSLTRGGDAVVMVQGGFSANSVIEKITADYEDQYKKGSSGWDWSAFKSKIEGGNNSNNTPYYGDYTVTAAYIAFPDEGGTETAPSNNNLLKVTITVGSQSLTTIFSKYE